jgi:AraC family transcriptional regulator
MLIYSSTSGVAQRTNPSEISSRYFERSSHGAKIPVRPDSGLKDFGQSSVARSQPLVRQADHSGNLEISPANIVTRRLAAWQGMRAEIIQCVTQDRIEFHFRASCHLLLVYEEGVRDSGETSIGDLARSTVRAMQRKLTFVPAGHDYREWQQPSVRARIICLYFDPANMPMPSNGRLAPAPLPPRLFFEDNMVWETAVRLAATIEDGGLQQYAEALGLVVAHELLRTRGQRRSPVRGGLAAWQQRIVANYVHEHLAEPVSLADLAQLVNLSTYYFCRAFKQSFGVPPHRYHTLRRIDQAKILLANPDRSVTETALSLGFSETSSFSAAFRHTTGTTPTAYRRAAG